MQRIGLKPGMHVADIGTGTGYFLPHLAKAVGASGSVLAIDIEPTMVRYVRERAARDKLNTVRPKLALVDDPLLEANSVDRVLIVNTWHHVPDRPAYAARLARALRSGGEVWVVDYTLESKQGPPVEHRLPPAKVVEELNAGGLAAEAISGETLPRQYLVVGRKK
jgi:ubiquinone/menaquinone biosynthesis C-methylase UbiE